MIDPLVMNRNLKYYPVGDIKECRIHGRNKIINGELPLFFSHSGVELASSGTELWVEIEADFSLFEPWVAFELNGSLIMRQMVLTGKYAICLYRGMTYGDEKRGFIYRELQAMSDDENCHIMIKGFYSDGDFKSLPKRSLKLEFVGDSITSGEGTYGAIYDMDWLPAYMSYSRTYAGIIEKKLNAEVRMISQGGWGVYSGWDNDRTHNIPSIYTKVCGFAKGESDIKAGAQKEYIPDDWQPDAVIINLGTNDVSGFDQPPFFDPLSGKYNKLSRNPDGTLKKEDTDKIEAAVSDFIKQIRKLYPKAYILWIYGMIGYELAPFLSNAVYGYKEETLDNNVFYLTVPETLPGEFGSRQHPGYESHKKIAAILADHLGKVLK